MKKIKLLFLIPTLEPGGAERVLVNLINNLDKSKYSITLLSICKEGIYINLIDKSIKYKYIFPFHMPKWFDLFKLFSPELLHRVFIKDIYDIEIAYLHGPCVRFISGCKSEKTKLAAWIHGTKSDEKDASHGFRNIEEACAVYNKFHKIVCVSDYVKNAFNDIFHLEDKTVVLPNVNETEKILKSVNDPLDINIDNEKFNIVSVGSLVKVKAFDRLVRIQKKLIDNNYNTHFYIIGKGREKHKLINLVKSLGLEKNITFCDFMSNPYNLISKCDLYVCSSLSEGLSTALSESIILGVPGVSVNVGGARELLGNKKYGIVCDNSEDSLFDSIKNLIEDKELYESLKNNLIIGKNEFLKENAIKKHEDLIRELTGK